MAKGSRRTVNRLPRRVKRVQVQTTRGIKDVFVDDASKAPPEAFSGIYSSPRQPYTPSFHSATPQSLRSGHIHDMSCPPSVIDSPKLTGKVRASYMVFRTTYSIYIVTLSQSQNDYLREWVPQKQMFLNHIIGLEAPRQSDHSCDRCKAVVALWRCNECFGVPEYCTACCRDVHLRHPLHRVEHWTGEYYTSAAVRLTGVYLSLGHGGDRCPSNTVNDDDNNPFNTPDDEFSDEESCLDFDDIDDCNMQNPFSDRNAKPGTSEDDDTGLFDRKIKDNAGNPIIHIVDISGIHRIGVKWCSCPNADLPAVQLLKARLYPASTISPRTAFTFRVLDDFLIENKECKTSALNYYNKLKRLTSNAFPHLVAVSIINSV